MVDPRAHDDSRDENALSAAEQEIVEGAADELRTFVAAREVPDLTDSVHRRLQESPAAPPTWESMLAALWAPRRIELRVRPALAVGAAAALALVFVLLVPDMVRPRGTPAGAAAPAELLVEFRLQMPDAKTVRLAGTFTRWEPAHELQQTAPGIWSVTVPLAPGVHDYMFVVDGERWVPDPAARQVDDGFGGVNSRIALIGQEGRRS